MGVTWQSCDEDMGVTWQSCDEDMGVTWQSCDEDTGVTWQSCDEDTGVTWHGHGRGYGRGAPTSLYEMPAGPSSPFTSQRHVRAAPRLPCEMRSEMKTKSGKTSSSSM
jgi:hypothetical protein